MKENRDYSGKTERIIEEEYDKHIKEISNNNTMGILICKREELNKQIVLEGNKLQFKKV